MNVLILTGHFGLGHVAAAKALEQEILDQNHAICVTTVDVIEDLYPQLRKLVYGCFDFTVNYCAGVYNLLNRMAGQSRCAPMKTIVVQKLDKLLQETQADLILSTLPLCSQYASAYKEATGSRIPLYTYITDICAHHEWIAPETDCYFVGDERTRRQLMDQGVAPDRIVVSGIPVRKEFKPGHGKHHTRRELLVMGGGLGLIPKAEELLSALAALPEVHVTVITGKNQALREELCRSYPSFTVLGFTDRVADYMAQADLLLTKAGGSTTFEAIHSGTPLCLLSPFLVQEEANADFVEANGFGRVLRRKGQEVQDLLDLLQDTQELAAMKQRMAVSLRTLDPETALDRFWGEWEAVC